MKLGIMFCIGLLLYAIECYLWYLEGVEQAISYEVILFIFMRVLSTVCIAIPILYECGVI